MNDKNSSTAHSPFRGLGRWIFIFLFFLSSNVFAANLKGRVTDKKGEPIPFVAIYIEGTTEGTTTNTEGYYSLELKPGTYKVIYKLFGFAVHSENIQMGTDDITKDITLEDDNLELNSVMISANSEDPAYAIIRKTIKKRKYHLEQVKEYACDAYIKGLQRVYKHPDKIFGKKVVITNLDSSTGIAYLSESVSKLYFREPDNTKEEMISSKVSGNNNGFSFNQESDFLFNFYKNNIQISELGERGFISPISNNALFSYNYHLVETYQENGRTIDKIEVIPKRKHDPVFRGYISIEESDWRLCNIDLALTKDAEINFVDSITISQFYVPVDSAIWLPFSNKIKFSFNVFGFKGDGVYIATNTRYNLHPNLPAKFFNGEVLKVDTDANKKDSAYWNATRPVPLTGLESRDYKKKDSLIKIHESKPYLDSIDSKANKFSLSSVILGYQYRQRYKKQAWFLSPLIQTIDFNTVQGLNVGARIGFNKEFKNYKRYSITASGGYGFSNQRWFGDAGFTYYYNPVMFSHFSLGAGVRPVQFNSDNPITPFINTLYTLLQDQNYMKLYQKESVKATNSNELANGIILQEVAEYADRTPLINSTNYQLVHIPGREYTSNDPVHPGNDSMPAFIESKSLTGSVQLQIHFNQKYILRPHERFILESNYPVLTLNYKKAIGGFGDDFADYDLVKANLTGHLGLKLFGESSYAISAGKFLTQKNVYFMDYEYFNGNQTIFIPPNPLSFQLLDYYKYSTTNPFVEVHVEHGFEGFFFNKIPLFRSLKLDEIVGVNYISSANIPQYIEFYVGIAKFQSLQIDFATGFMKNARVANGFRIGVGF